MSAETTFDFIRLGNESCRCGHQRAYHLGYVGGCRMCACTAMAKTAYVYSTGTNQNTEATR